jgi:hypothetical protein
MGRRYEDENKRGRRETPSTKNYKDRAKQTAEQTPARSPGSTYWLIVKDGNGLMEDVFTTNLDGSGEALPVFSLKEEAEAFIGSGSLGDGWRTRESRTGETISVLYTLCAGVEYVALDPPPEAEGTEGFTVLSRKSFVVRATDGGKAPQPRDPGVEIDEG